MSTPTLSNGLLLDCRMFAFSEGIKNSKYGVLIIVKGTRKELRFPIRIPTKEY